MKGKHLQHRRLSPSFAPRRRRLAFWFAAAALALGGPAGGAAAAEKITLQLKWQHQFQFAGYYAALERCYYREAGLDVSLQELTNNQ